MAHLKPDEGRNKLRNRTPSWVFALVGGAAYLLFGVLLALLLDQYIKPSDSSEKKDLVQALALIMAGVAGAIGIYFTWRGQWQTREDQEKNQNNTQEQLRNAQKQLELAQRSQEENQKATHAQLDNAQKQLRLTQEGQITERFTRAIDQLGHESTEVRIGGIYALAAIASESDSHYWPVIEILCAYIRNRSPWSPKGDYVCGEDSEPEEALSEEALSHHHRLPDIQAILYILTERERYYDEGEDKFIWLTNADLQHADLRGIHLERARLRGTNLKGARLGSAHLWRARLRNTILEEANLEEAQVQRADLEEAILCKADLEGADLRGADLRGANLQGAKALVQEQIDAACGNGMTTLPEDLQRPTAVWSKPIKEIQRAHLQN
jgi:uncharacterized protein YjbI with pentapeptide repeats